MMAPAMARLLARPMTMSLRGPGLARGFVTGHALYSAPKGRLGKGTDDRVVSAVVPSKLFLLTVFNGSMVLDSIYNRVASAGVAVAFGAGVVVYWNAQMVHSVLTLFVMTFLALLLILHVARVWAIIPFVAWLLYKFFF